MSPFARPDRLTAGLRVCAGALQRRLVRSWWREIILIGLLYGAYEVSRGMGDVDVDTAVANGREILHLERLWHLDPERVLNEALHHVTLLAVVASYFYSVMHYLVTPVVLVWMYRSHRADYGFARTALAISTGLGLIGYLFLPTAPPRMLEHSGLRDILADTQSYGWWGSDGSVPRGWGGLTNQFAAMPSLHVGWAVWCGAVIALYARHRWVRVLGVAYPVVTTLVVMATGNHYLLDAVAGFAVMGLGALLANAVPARFVTVPMGPERTVIHGVSPSEAARVRVADAQRIRAMAEWAPSAGAEEAEPVADDDRYCRLRR
jgi:hypothetical protein